MKTYDGPYGYTYYYDSDGDLLASPTLVDGGYDGDNFLYVSEFMEPLTDEEMEEVKQALVKES